MKSSNTIKVLGEQLSARVNKDGTVTVHVSSSYCTYGRKVFLFKRVSPGSWVSADGNLRNFFHNVRFDYWNTPISAVKELDEQLENILRESLFSIFEEE